MIIILKAMPKQYVKLVYCMVLLAVFVMMTFMIKKYFKPFFIILFLFMLTNPIKEMLDKHRVFNEKMNALTSIMFVNAAIAATMFFIGNSIYDKGSMVLEQMQKTTSSISYFVDVISKVLNIDDGNVSMKMDSIVTKLMNNDIIRQGAAYTTEGIFAYFIANMALYFILVDKYVILNWTQNFLPKSIVFRVKDKVNSIKKMVKIELALVMLTTVINIFGFWALGVISPVTLGLLCGVLDIVPYVGTILIFIPLIAYYIYVKDLIRAMGLILLYILLQVCRQVLETKFMSSKLEIHPLLIIISLYVGAKIFGLIGLFIGPMYMITAKEIIQMDI